MFFVLFDYNNCVLFVFVCLLLRLMMIDMDLKKNSAMPFSDVFCVFSFSQKTAHFFTCTFA